MDEIKLKENLSRFINSLRDLNYNEIHEIINEIFKDYFHMSYFELVKDDLSQYYSLEHTLKWIRTINNPKTDFSKIIGPIRESLPIEKMVITINCNAKIEDLPRSLERLYIESEEPYDVEIHHNCAIIVGYIRKLKSLHLKNVNIIGEEHFRSLETVKEIYLNKIAEPERVLISDKLEVLELSETKLDFYMRSPVKYIKIKDCPEDVDFKFLQSCYALERVVLEATSTQRSVKGRLPETVSCFVSNNYIIPDLEDVLYDCWLSRV